MISLLHVRSFLAVLDEGGLRAAARRLALSPSTVLDHLRALEQQLELALLVRGTGSPRPTAQAERFLPLARALIETAEQAGRLARSLPLRLAVATNIGVYLLQPALAAYQRRGADEGEPAAIDLWIGGNPEVAGRLTSGQADLAVMEWWDDRPGFRAETWRREPLCLIAAPDHRLAGRSAVPLEALDGEVLFGGERGTGTGTLLRRRLGARAAGLRTIDGLGSTEAVKRAVRSGRGLSLVLRGAVEEEVAAGLLVALEIEGVELAKELQLVLPEGLPAIAPAARFRDFLLGCDSGLNRPVRGSGGRAGGRG